MFAPQTAADVPGRMAGVNATLGLKIFATEAAPSVLWDRARALQVCRRVLDGMQMHVLFTPVDDVYAILLACSVRVSTFFPAQWSQARQCQMR